MDVYRAIQVLAYRDVLAAVPSPAYSLRRVFRWYAERYHTPLHVVETLPVYDVLRHHYEAHAEALAEAEGAEAAAQLQKELEELCRTPAEAAAAADAAAIAAWRDQEFERDLDEEAAAQQQRAEKKKLTTPAARAPVFQMAGDGVAAARPRPPAATTPAPPPGIKLSFGTEAELDALGAADGLGGLDP